MKRPEHGVVYVYNQFGEVIYTTHIKDAGSQIPMPKGGKVLFLGQRGDSFSMMFDRVAEFDEIRYAVIYRPLLQSTT